MMNNPFSGLNDSLNDRGFEIPRLRETYEHDDENSADNMLFVWNFYPSDLKTFVGMFNNYNNRPANEIALNNLKNDLRKKCEAMLRAECLPIECMLYASKVSNSRMNDELLNVLADRIAAVYLGNADDTVEVLEHILDRWTWTPQKRASIRAIGLIGECDELLSKICSLVDDDELKRDIFAALMERKNRANLERAMNIVAGLRNNRDVDRDISQTFRREFNRFGLERLELLAEYLGNPDVFMENLGRTTFKRIALDTGGTDVMGLDELARRSRDETAAYEEFRAVCLARRDEEVTFRCRFSRPEIVKDYLEPILYSTDSDPAVRDNALISIAQLTCARNYKAQLLPLARKFIAEYQTEPGHDFVCLTASIILNESSAIERAVELMSQNRAAALYNLYSLFNNASVVRSREALAPFQNAILQRLRELVRDGYTFELNNFVSNLQTLKSRNLSELISRECLDEIHRVLHSYVQKKLRLDDYTVVGLMRVGKQFADKQSGNDPFIKILYALYDQHEIPKIRNEADRMLQDFGIIDPTAR